MSYLDNVFYQYVLCWAAGEQGCQSLIYVPFRNMVEIMDPYVQESYPGDNTADIVNKLMARNERNGTIKRSGRLIHFCAWDRLRSREP